MFVFTVVSPFRLRVSQYFYHTPFPHPAHRTGRADFPHPALRLVSSNGTRKLQSMRNATLSKAPSSPFDKVPSVAAELSMGSERRIASIPTLSHFQHTQKSGPFPRPALPGVNGTTSLSVIPDDPACPSRETCWEPRPPIAGTSRVACRFLFHACRRHYPGGTRETSSLDCSTDNGLPRYSGGSASTLPVSRPAQRSHALRPACLLTPLREPFLEVLQSNSLPP